MDIAEYLPPFSIRINFRAIRDISNSTWERIYFFIISVVHETMHLLQFILLAHLDLDTYEKCSYQKMTEHQAYYITYLISKIFRMDFDYQTTLKFVWMMIDKDEEEYNNARK
jgi:hypothetical protein